MAIYLNPLLDILALIFQLVQPIGCGTLIYGSLLFDEFQGWKNNIVDMFTKKVRGGGAKLLQSKVYTKF